MNGFTICDLQFFRLKQNFRNFRMNQNWFDSNSF